MSLILIRRLKHEYSSIKCKYQKRANEQRKREITRNVTAYPLQPPPTKANRSTREMPVHTKPQYPQWKCQSTQNHNALNGNARPHKEAHGEVPF